MRRHGVQAGRSLRVALVVLAAATAPTALQAQVSAPESEKLVRAADGLEARLWAAEPMVVNPTSIDVDSRGRVWVAEGLNYRYTLHKDQPYFDEADRIKILEDTDLDGRADKVTVFADRIFPVPMGLAIEELYSPEGTYAGCKVYIGNSPNLLVLEDTDGDDRADKRYPLLTGFGGVDSDHGVHGMTFGPDGKLYFTQGDAGNKSKPGFQFEVDDASGRRVANNQLATTLRANRDGSAFEILADRQRNNYETSVDAFGHVFTSDNDDDGNRGCRVLQILDGGHYGYKTPGSPRHWGEEVPGNIPKLVGTGNGSPSGLMVYEGQQLPEPYRHSILEADAGTRQINHFPLRREGSVYRTEYRVFLHSEDPWFRPIDVAAAPDGSVLVADWYDSGVGGHAFSDQTTGRIYRVAAAGSKLERPELKFSNVEHLLDALMSPSVATRDAARRGFLATGPYSIHALQNVYDLETQHPLVRARALWIMHALAGDRKATEALTDKDPLIREMAVRILGQDDRENGQVSYLKTDVQKPPPALAHLEVLLPLVNDPDPAVRRELILALRNVPTPEAGNALRALAAAWDGQDRWYLESLGLALRHREPEFLSSLFDGNLYGDLALAATAHTGAVALPPYFPVDRNEAFLAAGEELPPANALSKSLGLMWQVHHAEVLPLLSRILPALDAPELQQAADDVIEQIDDPAGARSLAEVALATADPVRRGRSMATLARKLQGDWRPAAGDDRVSALVEAAFREPATRVDAIRLAAVARNEAVLGRVAHLVEEPGAPDDVRVAAVEAVARGGMPRAREILTNLVREAQRERAASPASEAAVRGLAALGETRDTLAGMMADESLPLPLRREALVGLSQQDRGGQELVESARAGTLPESLRTVAAMVLRTHADRGVREAAQQLFPIKTADGKPLPPVADLLRREGDPAKGRAVFFRAGPAGHATLACGACHRVQGEGQWIGPDLSTIGTKASREELLRSILSPSAAIGHNYRSLNVATADGRVLTGLPVEDTPERLLLKTADGQRVAIPTAEVEERSTSDVSLMPEGLAETLGEQDLVDLLAYLGTLRRPVSIVGEFEGYGPVAEPTGRPALDPQQAVGELRGRDGRPLTPRRITANAEGQVDVSALLGPQPEAGAAYLRTPVASPVDQEVDLVLDTIAPVQAWLGSQVVTFADAVAGSPRRARVRLPRGSTELVLRIGGAPDAKLVATFVAPAPLEFSRGEVARAGGR